MYYDVNASRSLQTLRIFVKELCRQFSICKGGLQRYFDVVRVFGRQKSRAKICKITNNGGSNKMSRTRKLLYLGITVPADKNIFRGRYDAGGLESNFSVFFLRGTIFSFSLSLLKSTVIRGFFRSRCEVLRGVLFFCNNTHPLQL